MENALFPLTSTNSQIFTTWCNFGFGMVKQLELLTAVSHRNSKITLVIRKGENIASSRLVLYTTDVVMLSESQLHLTDGHLATNVSQLESEMASVEVSKDVTPM
jgi:hypothetical protein